MRGGGKVKGEGIMRQRVDMERGYFDYFSFPNTLLIILHPPTETTERGKRYMYEYKHIGAMLFVLNLFFFF